MLKDIEEKVNSQQSVGVDVANARRVDRPLNKKGFDESDRDAARSIRSGKKKRKLKKRAAVPFFERAWVKGIGILLVLLVIAGGITYVLWPQSIDDAYADLQRNQDLTLDDRIEAIEEFLKSHGDAADPRIPELHEEYKTLAARRHLGILYKRYNSKFKDNAEGYSPNDYQLAVRALDAERAGEVGRAAGLWNDLKSSAKPLNEAELLNEEALRASVLGWIANEAVDQIRVKAPANFTRIKKELTDQYIYQRPIKEFNPNDPESIARRAIRFMRMTDTDAAHEKWKSLVSLTQEDPENRVWYILGTEQARLTEPPENAPDSDMARQTLLQTRLAKLSADWKIVQPDRANRKVEQRAIWNVSRDIVTLYEDSTDDKLTAIVKQARALVEATQADE